MPVQIILELNGNEASFLIFLKQIILIWLSLVQIIVEWKKKTGLWIIILWKESNFKRCASAMVYRPICRILRWQICCVRFSRLFFLFFFSYMTFCGNFLLIFWVIVCLVGWWENGGIQNKARIFSYVFTERYSKGNKWVKLIYRSRFHDRFYIVVNFYQIYVLFSC